MYGTVAKVSAAFPTDMWDPTSSELDEAAVAVMLTDWSATLDGEIGKLVSTPVDPSSSPHLAAVCDTITVLRVRADVLERLQSPEQAAARVKGWRDEAERLSDRIQRGATADGTLVGGAGPEAAGAPAFTGSATPIFTREQRF